jgi:myo-inositol 2-dehydrogenase/D-chiro-inositol 1-dehydrogenase
VATDAIRVAVIGAGRMGRVHLEALRLSQKAMASAIVEPLPAARNAVKGSGIRTYVTLDELLEAGGFDAVLVAAPSDLHVELVTRLAGAGLPVLCEKPCGLRSTDATAAAGAAYEAGTLLQIGYWRRFVPELGALRERIEAGELGEPLLVVCNQWDEKPPPTQFRIRSGGIAVDMAVHEIDQIRWLLRQEFEQVVGVSVGTGSEPALPNDPDSAIVLARLSRGSAATIAVGRRFPHGDSCWIELFASKGYERSLFMWGDEAENAFHAALAAQADAFADAVHGDPPRGATGDDAVAALAVAERIAEALTRPAGLAGRDAA